MRKVRDTELLLKEVLKVINQLPNTKINSSYFDDTYQLASEIEKHLKPQKEPKY